MSARLMVSLLLVLLPAFGADAQEEPTESVRQGAFCSGEYADDLTSLAPHVLAWERQPNAQSSSYCLRTTAVYECLSYGTDGTVRRSKRKVVSHGTAFGYRVQGQDTLLLTNQHVAEWPSVTDEDHRASDVPEGCKKVTESLRIVDNEKDAFEQDDVPLTKVVSDERLDVAVVKAKGLLQILPWKVGHSAALKERNAVDVRGFPLGAFRATNVGKVVSAWDHDDEKDWDHDDFVVDALLSQGNSGSPVLAVSCHTGEFELVGIYHAGYARGSALNVVIGIDQVREMMASLKKSPKPKAAEAVQTLVPRDRPRLTAEVQAQTEPFFPFGPLTAVVRTRQDGANVFALFPKEFPLQSTPLLVVEDLPTPQVAEFGELGRVWFGSARGLKGWDKRDLDADVQGSLQRLLDGFRRDALASFAFRQAAREQDSNREAFETVARLDRALKRQIASRGDLAQTAQDLAERYGPSRTEATVRLSEVMASPWLNPAFPGMGGALEAVRLPVESLSAPGQR